MVDQIPGIVVLEKSSLNEPVLHVRSHFLLHACNLIL